MQKDGEGRIRGNPGENGSTKAKGNESFKNEGEMNGSKGCWNVPFGFSVILTLGRCWSMKWWEMEVYKPLSRDFFCEGRKK